MSNEPSKESRADRLRRRAEEKMRAHAQLLDAPNSAVEMRRLIHELQVHQIELELQNEELVEARAEMESALARYTELYDFAPMGLFTFRRDGSIAKMNFAGAALLGQERGRLADTLLVSFVFAADQPVFRAFLTAVFASAEKQSCDLRLALPGPVERFVTLDATRAPDGAECRCVAIDTTVRTQLEQQVRRAQRMESIGTLASGIAHDLNNVLSPILMSIVLLRQRFPDPAILELIGTLEQSAEHGAAMIRQVLSFARGFEGERVEVSPAEMIGQIQKLANNTFLKQISVRTVLGPNLWAIVGDRTQLHQALLNLCVNARDAMPGGGTLTISAENCTFTEQDAALHLGARPGPYVLIHVADTGTGMPPEVLARIFDPFFTTKEVGKGTGLGLATTLSIVKSHGGLLNVTSVPGEGSRFSIHLPALPTPRMPPPGPADIESHERGHGETILVVDDEPPVRKATKFVLESFGYKVLLAQDGAEAVAQYHAQMSQIACVLTDLMMPGMDGTATIHSLRQLNPAVVIIAASGVSDDDPAARAAALGVRQFLPKPYTAQTLLRALHAALKA